MDTMRRFDLSCNLFFYFSYGGETGSNEKMEKISVDCTVKIGNRAE